MLRGQLRISMNAASHAMLARLLDVAGHEHALGACC